jgi:hypothetical protein
MRNLSVDIRDQLQNFISMKLLEHIPFCNLLECWTEIKRFDTFILDMLGKLLTNEVGNL